MNIFDAFLTRCVRDSIEGYPEAQEAPEIKSETTEQDHAHTCPECGCSWLHTNDACAEVTPVGRQNRMWMKCPWHEGRDSE